MMLPPLQLVEPALPIELPAPPDHLSETMQNWWRQTVADYDLATHTRLYRPWLQAQAGAILAHAVSDGARRTRCATPHRCQFGLYWSRYVAPASAPVPVSLASQTSALQALTAALTG